MKKPIRVVALIVGLAGALLAGGTLLPTSGDDRPSDAETSDRGTGRLLAPAVDPRGLDTTVTTLEERVEAIPEDWRSWASLGLAYLQKNRLTADPTFYLKAEEALDRSLELNDTENFQSMLGLGALALARHDFAAGLEWGRRAKVVNPYNAQVRGVIGDALVELGRYEAAGRAFQEMIDLRPDLSSYARVSYFRELHGDVPGAIEAMTSALDTTGSGEDAAWAAYQLGELYFTSDRVAEAKHEFERGASLAPDYFLPTVGLAKVAAARGNFGLATRLLSEVVDRYPAPEYVVLLGDIYARAGRPEEAEIQYELVRAIDKLYKANGVNTDLETALFDADHGVNLDDALRSARAEYQRRQSIHVADALAWTLYAKERYREAKHFSRISLRLGTRDARLLFHAGMIDWRLGDDAAARRHLASALSINPNFSFVQDELARRTVARLGG
ncbi:MAG: tetratricopeptide repeat protein [Actinomycetota bacterium]